MPDLSTTRHAVRRNCHVADATTARDQALCVYLLKMRELYRWEKRYPLSRPLDREAVGSWLVEREQLWDELEEAELEPVPLAGQRYDPFDAAGINAALGGHRLVYGAGLGRAGHVQFFLAELDRVDEHAGIPIYISAREHARSLSAPPAMSSEQGIHVRREAIRRLAWELLEEWQWKRRPGPAAELARRFDAAGDPERAIDGIARVALPGVIAHEIGEREAERVLGPGWSTMLSHLVGRPAEHWARAARDLLADCLVTLPALLREDDRDGALFHAANLRGMRRQLFPALAGALSDWIRDGRRQGIEDCIERGIPHWRETCVAMIERVQAAPATAADDLESWILERSAP